jgi:NAD(P)H-flavin reductase
MSGWHLSTVTGLVPLVDELFTLTVSVPPAIAKAYHTPGQYHRLGLGEGAASTLAMASPPGHESFEYVIKRQGAAAALGTLAPGAQVKVSLPEGKGFPLAVAEGRTLLVIGAGTGVAPLRAVLKHVAQHRGRFGKVVALFGLRTHGHLPWPEEVAPLAATGLDVRVTLTAPHAGWAGLTGRVQAHLGALPVDDAVAFVAGPQAMLAEATAALGTRGLPPERVFKNF